LLVVLGAVPALAQTGAITGRVTGSDTGQPVVSALVEAVRAGGQVAGTTLTNQDGAFRIAGLSPGTYTVRASATGYAEGTSEPVQVSGGSASVSLALAPQAIPLNPVVVSASRKTEKALDAPARVDVVSEAEIRVKPAVTSVDYLRDNPAVDIISQGLQSTNVVVRGFNNIFSGAVQALTDYRIASVPSLRVNVMSFVPNNNDDIERIEVVQGPGSALYGPNASNGVIHIITKSPLQNQGTTLALSGGNQSLVMGTFRTSQLLSENVGFKISGQYFRGDEWPYTDPVEQQEKEKFASDPFWKQDLMNATGISSAEADKRISQIGNRDYSLERWGSEARLDWRMSDAAAAVFTAGVSNSSQIELTGLGGGQASDWRYIFGQARLNWNRLFAQFYLNSSDAGDTYLLRNGQPIVDKSKLYVGQVQHGFDIGSRQQFVYGVDLLHTLPRTEGTINGKYENDDETTELGAYVQSETALTPKLDLVLAARVDDHSALPDLVFSPRAAFVFKPDANQAIRLTYNRAFSTPTSLNQFLDLPTAVPNATLARLGYSVRVQGTGTDGFRFRQSSGGYLMRSPFTPAALGGPKQLLPADAATFWSAAVQVVAQQAEAMGQPLDPQLLGYLLSLSPTSSDIGTNYLNTVNGATGSLASLDLPDTDPIREDGTTMFELGYQGIVGGKLLLAADVWHSRRSDFVTALTTLTPLLTLNPQQMGQYLVTRLMTDLQMPQAQAAGVVGQLAPLLAQVPVGVISSEDVDANGAQLLASYQNVNKTIKLWGGDFSATYLATERFSLTGSASWVNDDVFKYVTGSDTTNVALNAPTFKLSLGSAYRNEEALSGDVHLRFTNGFPAISGVYDGTRCLYAQGQVPTALEVEDCVDSYALVDLGLSYRLPMAPRAYLDLNMQNLLDEKYRSFPGVPDIGRSALLRLRYEF
jgi:iron complex outermembrane receptor protein